MASSRDRQEALRAFLRGRDTTSAAEVAAHFGVSARTAHRDLTALRRRGVPVAAAPGLGGGFTLSAAHDLSPLTLSLEQALAAVWMGRWAQWCGGPTGDSSEQVLAALEGCLPLPTQEALIVATRRVWVGPPAQQAAPTAPLERVFWTFTEAMMARKNLSFCYRDRDGNRVIREVEPQALLIRAPRAYLLAFDLELDGPRRFRLEDIEPPISLLVTRFVPAPPEAFESFLNPDGAEVDE